MSQIGDTIIAPSTDPWTRATEFDKEFIVPIYNSLVGNLTKPVQVVDEFAADGKTVLKSHIEWVDEADKDITPIVNKRGGNFIYRELKIIFSRPAALGNLSNDELVNIAADDAEAIFVNLIINDIEYGVDIDKLLFEMPTFLNTLHMYLTSIKNGGLLEFGKQTIGIGYNAKPQEQQSQSPYDKVVSAATKG